TREELVLIEVDAQGQQRRIELFDPKHLTDAIARLYERYAKLLPDGQERERATTTARVIARAMGPFGLVNGPDGCAPDIQVVDHRPLATFTARGAETVLKNWNAWFDIADDLMLELEDVLGAQFDALLVQRTLVGIDRAGGGRFERQFLVLTLYGNDGRMTRVEYFDADRADEALARFDELTGYPSVSPLGKGRIEGGSR